MSNSQSFIFLPDISGFTEFVNRTEVEHSSHIIKELLELLIDEQDLGLTLAEIEGDALFFYSYQQVPTPEALFKQAKKMFQLFHSHLLQYDHLRICQCGACSTAKQLTLKFISHAGPLEFIQIKDQRKPFGKEVISAHRLMKNDVPSDEYLLLSEGVTKAWEKQWSSPSELTCVNCSSTYDFGKMGYQYYTLENWKNNLPVPTLSAPGRRVKNPIKVSMLMDAPAASVFEIISNLEYRLLWNKELTGLQFDRTKINRAGAEHLCIINERELLLETVESKYVDGRWEYGERLKKGPIPFLTGITNYFIIEEQGTQTLVNAEIHLPFAWLFKTFFQKGFKRMQLDLLKNIKEIAEEEEIA